MGRWRLAAATQVDCYYFCLSPEKVAIKRKINSRSWNTLDKDRNKKHFSAATFFGKG